jgi:hypothetical protein
MHQTISELKRSGDPYTCNLLAILKRNYELPAEEQRKIMDAACVAPQEQQATESTPQLLTA